MPPAAAQDVGHHQHAAVAQDGVRLGRGRRVARLDQDAGPQLLGGASVTWYWSPR